MSDTVQTDVSRPSALPSARLRPQGSTATQSSFSSFGNVDSSLNSAEYLDAVEEEWNKKIDVEIETLVDGMADIVSLASMEDKDKFRIAQESFQAQCRAESMVRAAHSLLSITHSMKLLLLLSDESQIAAQRDHEMQRIKTKATEYRDEVAGLVDELLTTRSSAPLVVVDIGVKD